MNTDGSKDINEYKPKNILIDTYREFGLPGVITYSGGAFMLFYFPWQTDTNKQVLYAVSGFILLFLATFILYIRI